MINNIKNGLIFNSKNRTRHLKDVVKDLGPIPIRPSSSHNDDCSVLPQGVIFISLRDISSSSRPHLNLSGGRRDHGRQQAIFNRYKEDFYNSITNAKIINNISILVRVLSHQISIVLFLMNTK